LRPKNNEYSIIFPTRKLLHEFIVDVWVTTKQAWLHWVKMNEAILKAYIYQGLGLESSARYHLAKKTPVII
jgi:hypothetical protein